MSFSKTLQRCCKTFQSPFHPLKCKKESNSQIYQFHHIFHEVIRTTHSATQACPVTLSPFRDIRNKEPILPTEIACGGERAKMLKANHF